MLIYFHFCLLHQQVDYESLIFTKERVLSMGKRKAAEGEGRVKDVAGTRHRGDER